MKIMQVSDAWLIFLSDIFIKLIETLFLSIFVYLIGYILKSVVKKVSDYNPNAVNWIILIIDIFQLSSWIIGVLWIFQITDPAVLLGGSAFIVSIISISSSSIGMNLVGGLYILLTRPYGIGDLIRYNNNVGVVTEISLNYTRIIRLNQRILTIPNSLMMNANIQNYNIHPRIGEDPRNLELHEKRLLKLTKIITTPILTTLSQNELIRFTFSIELRLDELPEEITVDEVSKRIDKVLKTYVQIFGYKPEFYLVDYIFRLILNITITSSSSKSLFENYPQILEDIIIEIFDASGGD